MALILPALGLICLVAIDYSRLFYTLATLSDCARSGAYFAVTTPSATSVTIQQAALNDAGNLSPAPTVGSATVTDSSGNVTVQVTVTATFATLSYYPGISRSFTLVRKVAMIRTY